MVPVFADVHGCTMAAPIQTSIEEMRLQLTSDLQMLSNIANDLDLLLTDLCHLYPLPATSANQKPCLIYPVERQEISPYDIPREKMRNFISGSKQSLQSLSASEPTSTADSGHDITTPGSVSPEMPLYHVEPVLKKHELRSVSNSPISVDINEQDHRPISTFERVSKTHSIWLLPEIGRSGAVHLLKDRPTGSFVVRQSSQPRSLAMSVQHQQTTCASVDHYIIESGENGVRLQGSVHHFPSIPHLVDFYITTREELPSQLILPSVIMNAKSSKELSSLALLGQDFWHSTVSRHNSSESLISGVPVLHKSCSEPINITQPLAHFPPEPPVKPKGNFPPSLSLCDFSKFIIDRKHARTDEDDAPPIPPKLEGICEDASFEYERAAAACGSDFPRARDEPDTSLSSRASPCCRGSREKKVVMDVKAKTHPGASSKGGKSGSYSGATSIDVLHIPEASYFRSSLEDKMSDYEDIWRSSVCDGDSVRGASVKCNMWTQTHDLFGCYDSRTHNDVSPTQNESGISTLSSDGGSLPRNCAGKAVRPKNLSLNTGDESLEYEESGGHERVLLTEEHDRAMCVSSVSVSCQYQHHQYQHHQQQQTKPRTNPYSSSVVVKMRESSNSSSAPKMRPPPLPTLSRIKSNSTSSLSTLAQSPIYAEPADAVEMENGMALSMRLRRRSAPCGIKVKLKKQSDLAQQKQQQQRRRPTPQKVSQQPQLETIFSPRHAQSGDTITDATSFVFSFGHQHVETVTVAETKSSRRVEIGRSQSMRSTTESSGRKVTRQRSLKEKFARLKTDMLRFRNHEHQKTTECSAEGKPVTGSGLDDALFSLEDLAQNSHVVESPLHKFPVYKKSALELNLNRVSCFSDSSTVQDLISCAHPEFNIRPIQALTVRNVKCVSEYDNLRGVYGPGSVSTTGTVFCNPWDNSSLEKLLRSQNGTAVLEPAMDSDERVQRWQAIGQIESEKLNHVVRDDVGLTNYGFIPAGHSAQDSCASDVTSIDSMVNGSTEVSSVQTTISQTSAISPTTHVSNSHGADTLESAHVNVALDDTQGGIIIDPSDDDLSDIITSDLRERLRPIVSRSSHSNMKNPGGKIREYIFRLSSDHNTTFGSTIENFIDCTLESQERNPHYVMRNVRQFMTGIKNYLVKHGEGELEGFIERERAKLGVNEFLNIDAIIESTLHVCVLQPVKHHIYKLFVDDHTRSGSLRLMTKNIKYARTKTPEEIGIKPGIKPPRPEDMDVIKHHLDKMQRAYSPLKKLENLLSATSMIYQCVRNKQHGSNRGQQPMGADDFLPMLIYVMVHCGLVSGEIEADYMWGLLHPSLLTGEGGYYLTTFSSAVLVLKNFQEAQETSAAQRHGRLPSISDLQGFLKLAIPDEVRDSIIWKTLPIRPSMNTKEVCALIAHKFKITNPQDYGLYLLVDGEESYLADNLCPQMIKGEYLASTQEVVFAYKRTEANIAWPKNLKKPIAMQDKV